jgi:hypothetical protein
MLLQQHQPAYSQEDITSQSTRSQQSLTSDQWVVVFLFWNIKDHKQEDSYYLFSCYFFSCFIHQLRPNLFFRQSLIISMLMNSVPRSIARMPIAITFGSEMNSYSSTT